MRYRRRIPPLRGKALWLVRLALVLAVAVGLVSVMDEKLSPVVQNVAGYRLRVFATKTINDAVTEELEREDISYASLVTISRDKDGAVTDIQTDVLRVNRLQAGVTEKIVQTLDEPQSRELSIALGSLTGLQMLAGRGPMVRFHITPLGAVETRIENQFESAGINQTLHRIMLVVTMDAAASNSLCRVPAQVVTSVCIAETVIVGEIPQAYTNVEGADRDDLFDHRAGQEMYQGRVSQQN